MDDLSFDRLTRLLGATPTRRNALGLAVGAAIGGFAGLLGLAESDAKKKKRKGCPKKPCPQGQQRNKRTCQCECVRTPCRGGMEFDAKSCQCRCPRDMRECRDGCVGRDQCCPGDPPCPEDPKGCCHAPGLDVCTIDGCCRELDGMKACNDFCVDTNTNRNHCGGCNSPCGPEEACANGECRPVDACPDGRAPCPGKPGGDGPFCRPPQHESCCGDTSCNALHDCCDPAEGVCCLRGRCVEGRCCTGNREVCAGKCCPFGEICCGGECCSAMQCIDGACCHTGVCGAAGSSSQVCRTDEEFCCHVAPDNHGYACPRGDRNLHVECAPGGRCCPAGTFYKSQCDACCEDLFLTCGSQTCVPPTPGRT